MEFLPPSAPRPRLCHIKKRRDFDGFGFNLHAEKSRAGQYIGLVDENSPAKSAGLLKGDRIVEVNGVNIYQENHKQVVQRIRAIPDETRLLVVDKPTEEYYEKRDIIVRGNMANVMIISSEKDYVNSEIFESEEDEIIYTERKPEDYDQPPPLPETPPPMSDPEDEDEIFVVGKRNLEFSSEKKLNTISVIASNSNSCDLSAKSSTSRTPSQERDTKNKIGSSNWDGLNLNMSAAKMREIICSKKKHDPRNERLDFQKKFEIIQTL